MRCDLIRLDVCLSDAMIERKCWGYIGARARIYFPFITAAQDSAHSRLDVYSICCLEYCTAIDCRFKWRYKNLRCSPTYILVSSSIWLFYGLVDFLISIYPWMSVRITLLSFKVVGKGGMGIMNGIEKGRMRWCKQAMHRQRRMNHVGSKHSFGVWWRFTWFETRKRIIKFTPPILILMRGIARKHIQLPQFNLPHGGDLHSLEGTHILLV